MRRYRFRLDQVRRVRRAEEDRVRAALQLANREVVAAAAKLEAREGHLRTLPTPAVRLSPGELARERAVSGMAAAAVIASRHDLEGARATATERVDAWHVASARVKALDRLDERHRAEHAIDVARDEARVVDEMVMGRRLRDAARERTAAGHGGVPG